MKKADPTSPEQPVLRARARGTVSADAAFEQLYVLYAPAVLAWLVIRVKAAEADDLFQDVWTIFYSRWRRWQHPPEMDTPEARPVLSFLYRTCHFVLQGHRRRAARLPESLQEVELSDGKRQSEKLLKQLEFGRCMELARAICPPEEMDVLLAKLAGVPAREIARTLQTTEPVVDHRFRNAVARLQRELRPKGKSSGKRRGKHA